jgi:hypothetical protein
LIFENGMNVGLIIRRRGRRRKWADIWNSNDGLLRRIVLRMLMGRILLRV